MDSMDIDFEWYLAEFNNLYDTYGDSYVAIKNKKVIGVYNSFAEGVRETEKTEGLGAFIIQKCGRDESAYTTYVLSPNLMII